MDICHHIPIISPPDAQGSELHGALCRPAGANLAPWPDGGGCGEELRQELMDAPGRPNDSHGLPWILMVWTVLFDSESDYV